jgi:HEAT repeat protein
MDAAGHAMGAPRDKLSERTRGLVEDLYNPPSLRRVAEECALLDAIGASCERAAFIYVLPFLLFDAMRANAVAALARLMEDMRVQELWNFAEFRGGNHGIEFQRMKEWFHLEPSQVALLGQEDPDSVWALGVASAHGNGHVREEAIRLLAKRHEPAALLFLIPHVNEWVPQIRLRAKTALLAKLQEAPGEFAMALPLLERLRKSRRDDHAVLVDAIRAALRNEPGLHSLRAAIVSGDRLIRRAAYLLALSSDEASIEDLIGSALACDDIRVCMSAARLVMARPALASWVQSLRTSRVPSVRRLVLDRAVASSDLGDVRNFLLDRNAGVRSSAQFYLRGEKATEVAAFYREALRTSSDTAVATALLGIGEVKSISDLEIVRPFLTSAKPRIRAAALAAVDRLAGAEAVSALSVALMDPSPRVAKTALTALQLRPGALSANELLDIFGKCNEVHVKKNAVRLMADLTRWNALACLLHCAVDATTARSLAMALIDVWIRHANRSFVSPNDDEAVRIDQALATAKDILGSRASELASQLDMWMPARRSKSES